jgi:hypothetical protein
MVGSSTLAAGHGTRLSSGHEDPRPPCAPWGKEEGGGEEEEEKEEEKEEEEEEEEEEEVEEEEVVEEEEALWKMKPEEHR